MRNELRNGIWRRFALAVAVAAWILQRLARCFAGGLNLCALRALLFNSVRQKCSWPRSDWELSRQRSLATNSDRGLPRIARITRLERNKLRSSLAISHPCRAPVIGDRKSSCSSVGKRVAHSLVGFHLTAIGQGRHTGTMPRTLRAQVAGVISHCRRNGKWKAHRSSVGRLPALLRGPRGQNEAGYGDPLYVGEFTMPGPGSPPACVPVGVRTGNEKMKAKVSKVVRQEKDAGSEGGSPS